jgi:hypothetical protein
MRRLRRSETASKIRALVLPNKLDISRSLAITKALILEAVSLRRKRRIPRQMEEWQLLAQHYCIAWGWRDRDDIAAFAGWKDLEGQQGE